MIYNAANTRGAVGLGIRTAVFAATAGATIQWVPGDLISGWSEDGTTVSFPIASLAEHNLTAANADATTGDARAVIAALCSRFAQWNSELTNQPTALTATINSRQMITSGSFTGKDKQQYRITVYLNYPAATVADEV